MKKIIYLFVLLLAGNLYGQSLSVFDVDASNFPVMKAKFYAFGADGKQMLNLSPSDFEITENGESRDVTFVSCPSPKPALAISSVLTIDISGSMRGAGIQNAKAAATSWIEALPLGQSECAITSFNSANYFNSDFTTDKQKLLDAVEGLQASGGTDYDAGFKTPAAGALLASLNAKHKRIIVFLTDGDASGDEAAIIQKANQLDATVYCVTLGMPCPHMLRNISEKTGGAWFENVTTEDQTEKIYLKILGMAQGSDPCEIEWESEIDCDVGRVVEVRCLPISKEQDFSYFVPNNKSAKLIFNLYSINFGGVEPGSTKDTTVVVTAENLDFSVSDITISNPDFNITPKSFSLKGGESIELTISFTPSDRGYCYCRFAFEAFPCSKSLYVIGGFPGVGPQQSTLKLTHPNGGEKFLVGSDTIITWEGIAPVDKVSLGYSTDDGNSWKSISDSASGLSYKWENIPSPASDQCLLKVQQYSSILDSNLQWISPGHTDFVQSVDWSPDGTKVVSGSWDNTIKIWDAVLGTEISTLLGHTDHVWSVNWSPDGSQIVSGSGDSTVKLWDVTTGTEIWTASWHTSHVLSVNWSPDGTKIASGSNDNTVKIYDAATGTVIKTLNHTSGVRSVNWSPDGTKIASGGGWNVKIWDAVTGEEIISLFHNHTQGMESLNWSPDGLKVATGGWDKIIKIWDAVTGKMIIPLFGHTAAVFSVNWSPDGTKIVSGSRDRKIKIWNIVTGKEIITWKGHIDNVKSVKWSSDGTKIVSGSWDKTVKIWDAVTGNEIRTLAGHTDQVFSVSWSPDGTKVASGSQDNTIMIWDAASGTEISTLSGHSGNVYSVSWSPDGTKIASGGQYGAIKIWNAFSGAEIITILGPNAVVYSVSWSPDGTKIASGSEDNTIKIWDEMSGIEIRTISGHSGIVYRVSWSPDGTKIASGSRDKTIKIWDALSGNEISTLSGHRHYVSSISWSPDGTRIVSGSFDFGKTIKIWDALNGTEISTLLGHEEGVNSVSWSPDGSKITSGSDDQTIKIWDVSSGKEIRTLLGHKENVSSVSWSPDGTRIASGSHDTKVRVWIVGLPLLQSDISDSLFAIVAPESSSKDIDMLQVLVGSTKDSVITDFISNTGTYPFRVDSIYFRGADAGVFSLVSGIPKYEVAASSTQYAEFSFKPTEARIFRAEIVIITQADTLVQNIIGEGIQPVLEIAEEIIDFGKVHLTKHKDKNNIETIRNSGTAPITISETKHVGPNSTDFTTEAGGGAFTLAAGEAREMNLRFTANDLGRTSGAIEFHYDGFGSPAVVRLYGEGIEKAPRITALGENFPTLYCASSSTNKLLLSNPGAMDLIISEITMTGANLDEFTYDFQLPITIESDETKSIDIVFAPKSPGIKTIILEIKSNADPDSLLTVVVSARKDSVNLEPELIAIDLGLLCWDETKDFVIPVTNKGTTLCGGHAELSANIEVSDYELILNEAETQDLQFSFTGFSTDGLIDETVIIIDSICGFARQVKITGEVAQPVISAEDIEIWALLGTMNEGKIIVRNSSNREFTIAEPTPISIPFEIINTTFPMTVPPQGTSEITIRYTSADEIKDVTSIVIEAEPCLISKQIIVLGSPDPAAGTIQIIDSEAYPGDEIEILILLKDQNYLLQSGATSLKTDLIFNPTLLYPYDYQIEKIDESTAKITIDNLPVNKNKGDELSTIRFKVALGNSETCDLILSNVETVGGVARISVINGSFTLLGICREGGDRLIKPVPQAGIKSISPNPAENKLNIEFTINEPGYTEISIYNILGEKVKTLFAENVSEPRDKSISADIKELGSGQYLLIFKTAAFMQSSQFIILK